MSEGSIYHNYQTYRNRKPETGAADMVKDAKNMSFEDWKELYYPSPAPPKEPPPPEKSLWQKVVGFLGSQDIHAQYQGQMDEVKNKRKANEDKVKEIKQKYQGSNEKDKVWDTMYSGLGLRKEKDQLESNRQQEALKTMPPGTNKFGYNDKTSYTLDNIAKGLANGDIAEMGGDIYRRYYDENTKQFKYESIPVARKKDDGTYEPYKYKRDFLETAAAKGVGQPAGIIGGAVGTIWDEITGNESLTTLQAKEFARIARAGKKETTAGSLAGNVIHGAMKSVDVRPAVDAVFGALTGNDNSKTRIGTTSYDIDETAANKWANTGGEIAGAVGTAIAGGAAMSGIKGLSAFGKGAIVGGGLQAPQTIQNIAEGDGGLGKNLTELGASIVSGGIGGKLGMKYGKDIAQGLQKGTSVAAPILKNVGTQAAAGGLETGVHTLTNAIHDEYLEKQSTGVSIGQQLVQNSLPMLIMTTLTEGLMPGASSVMRRRAMRPHQVEITLANEANSIADMIHKNESTVTADVVDMYVDGNKIPKNDEQRRILKAQVKQATGVTKPHDVTNKIVERVWAGKTENQIIKEMVDNVIIASPTDITNMRATIKGFEALKKSNLENGNIDANGRPIMPEFYYDDKATGGDGDPFIKVKQKEAELTTRDAVEDTDDIVPVATTTKEIKVVQDEAGGEQYDAGSISELSAYLEGKAVNSGDKAASAQVSKLFPAKDVDPVSGKIATGKNYAHPQGISSLMQFYTSITGEQPAGRTPKDIVDTVFMYMKGKLEPSHWVTDPYKYTNKVAKGSTNAVDILHATADLRKMYNEFMEKSPKTNAAFIDDRPALLFQEVSPKLKMKKGEDPAATFADFVIQNRYDVRRLEKKLEVPIGDKPAAYTPEEIDARRRQLSDELTVAIKKGDKAKEAEILDELQTLIPKEKEMPVQEEISQVIDKPVVEEADYTIEQPEIEDVQYTIEQPTIANIPEPNSFFELNGRKVYGYSDGKTMQFEVEGKEYAVPFETFAEQNIAIKEIGTDSPKLQEPAKELPAGKSPEPPINELPSTGKVIEQPDAAWKNTYGDEEGIKKAAYDKITKEGWIPDNYKQAQAQEKYAEAAMPERKRINEIDARLAEIEQAKQAAKSPVEKRQLTVEQRKLEDEKFALEDALEAQLEDNPPINTNKQEHLEAQENAIAGEPIQPKVEDTPIPEPEPKIEQPIQEEQVLPQTEQQTPEPLPVQETKDTEQTAMPKADEPEVEPKTDTPVSRDINAEIADVEMQLKNASKNKLPSKQRTALNKQLKELKAEQAKLATEKPVETKNEPEAINDIATKKIDNTEPSSLTEKNTVSEAVNSNDDVSPNKSKASDAFIKTKEKKAEQIKKQAVEENTKEISDKPDERETEVFDKGDTEQTIVDGRPVKGADEITKEFGVDAKEEIEIGVNATQPMNANRFKQRYAEALGSDLGEIQKRLEFYLADVDDKPVLYKEIDKEVLDAVIDNAMTKKVNTDSNEEPIPEKVYKEVKAVAEQLKVTDMIEPLFKDKELLFDKDLFENKSTGSTTNRDIDLSPNQTELKDAAIGYKKLRDIVASSSISGSVPYGKQQVKYSIGRKKGSNNLHIKVANAEQFSMLEKKEQQKIINSIIEDLRLKKIEGMADIEGSLWTKLKKSGMIIGKAGIDVKQISFERPIPTDIHEAGIGDMLKKKPIISGAIIGSVGQAIDDDEDDSYLSLGDILRYVGGGMMIKGASKYALNQKLIKKQFQALNSKMPKFLVPKHVSQWAKDVLPEAKRSEMREKNKKSYIESAENKEDREVREKQVSWLEEAEKLFKTANIKHFETLAHLKGDLAKQLQKAGARGQTEGDEFFGQMNEKKSEFKESLKALDKKAGVEVEARIVKAANDMFKVMVAIQATPGILKADKPQVIKNAGSPSNVKKMLKKHGFTDAQLPAAYESYQKFRAIQDHATAKYVENMLRDASVDPKNPQAEIDELTIKLDKSAEAVKMLKSQYNRAAKSAKGKPKKSPEAQAANTLLQSLNAAKAQHSMIKSRKSNIENIMHFAERSSDMHHILNTWELAKLDKPYAFSHYEVAMNKNGKYVRVNQTQSKENYMHTFKKQEERNAFVNEWMDKNQAKPLPDHPGVYEIQRDGETIYVKANDKVNFAEQNLFATQSMKAMRAMTLRLTRQGHDLPKIKNQMLDQINAMKADLENEADGTSMSQKEIDSAFERLSLIESTISKIDNTSNLVENIQDMFKHVFQPRAIPYYRNQGVQGYEPKPDDYEGWAKMWEMGADSEVKWLNNRIRAVHLRNEAEAQMMLSNQVGFDGDYQDYLLRMLDDLSNSTTNPLNNTMIMKTLDGADKIFSMAVLAGNVVSGVRNVVFGKQAIIAGLLSEGAGLTKLSGYLMTGRKGVSQAIKTAHNPNKMSKEPVYKDPNLNTMHEMVLKKGIPFQTSVDALERADVGLGKLAKLKDKIMFIQKYTEVNNRYMTAMAYAAYLYDTKPYNSSAMSEADYHQGILEEVANFTYMTQGNFDYVYRTKAEKAIISKAPLGKVWMTLKSPAINQYMLYGNTFKRMITMKEDRKQYVASALAITLLAATFGGIKAIPGVSEVIDVMDAVEQNLPFETNQSLILRIQESIKKTCKQAGVGEDSWVMEKIIEAYRKGALSMAVSHDISQDQSAFGLLSPFIASQLSKTIDQYNKFDTDEMQESMIRLFQAFSPGVGRPLRAVYQLGKEAKVDRKLQVTDDEYTVIDAGREALLGNRTYEAIAREDKRYGNTLSTDEGIRKVRNGFAAMSGIDIKANYKSSLAEKIKKYDDSKIRALDQARDKIHNEEKTNDAYEAALERGKKFANINAKAIARIAGGFKDKESISYEAANDDVANRKSQMKANIKLYLNAYATRKALIQKGVIRSGFKLKYDMLSMKDRQFKGLFPDGKRIGQYNSLEDKAYYFALYKMLKGYDKKQDDLIDLDGDGE